MSRCAEHRGVSRWRPGWKMTLFVAAMMPVLISLGFWQLDRAAEKRGYQQRYEARLGALPVAPPPAPADAQFLRVRVSGRYEPDAHYLVDNRVRQGRPGYWVVSRFRADDGRRWLVNRGWVAAPPTRDRLPAVTAPQRPVTLVGVLWPDMGLPPLLAPDPWPEDWPKRVQRLDVARMARQAPDVMPVELRLEPAQPGVYAAAPLSVDFAPERHQAYAVQWFGLALVLVVGYVVFGLRRA